MFTTTTTPALPGHERTMLTSDIAVRAAWRVTPLLLFLVACGGGEAAETVVAKPPVQIAAEQMAVVDSLLVENGPSLSGTLMAERTAQVRSQLGGTVLAVYVREGQRVAAGTPIALIDSTVAAEQARSARSALRSAEVAAQLATRNEERSAALLKAGAIADRDFEAARAQALQATAMVADAASRLASASKTLRDATVRAPFAGVISELPISAGDVVQGGAGGATLLAVVVDPSELTLEASVPAEHLGAIKRGAQVEFRLNGLGEKVVTGKVDRINPAVDAVTRQVRIYVAVPNRDGALASGLFAEGRVTVEARRALAIPLNALDPRATAPAVKRLRGGVVESVPVVPGLRDELRERVAVTGLSRGDTVLVGGALGTPTGSSVRITRADG
jgi:RND family efflux transporter MFP subunit